ncbi:MAG: hypothetical protein ACRBI6_20530 [Acidimicrobiales bacterium]
MSGEATQEEPVRRPIVVADRPLGAIDLIDGAFTVIRSAPKVIVSLAALIVLPVAVFQGLVLRDTLGETSLLDSLETGALVDEEQPFSFGVGTQAMLFLLDWLVLSLIGVVVALVVDEHRQGREATVSSIVRRLVPLLPRWALAFVLVHVVELVGLVLLVLPGLAAVVALSLTSPVLALEGLGAWASLRRSATLVRRSPGVVLVVMLVLFGVSYAVSYAIELLPSIGLFVLPPDAAWPLSSVSVLLNAIIMQPVTAAAMTLVYFDLRYRTEAYDLDLRRAALVGR